MVQCDLAWLDARRRSPQSPRTILKAQLRPAPPSWAASRWPAPSWSSSSSTTPTSRRWDRGYRDLTPANQYNVDYSILGDDRVEPLLRDIRNDDVRRRAWTSRAPRASATSASTRSASCTTRRSRTADNHVVYKTAAKEIAAQHGQSLTFMAKYDEREGNSCHIHLSLRGADGAIVFGDDDRDGGRSELYDHFVAGVLATMRDFTLLLRAEHQLLQAVRRRLVRADRRRLGHATTAPARCGWSVTAPGCADGEPAARRRREPLPRPRRDAGRRPARHRERARARAGARRQRLHVRQAARARRRCTRPATLFAASAIARAAFGDEVVDHYINMADVELAAFDAAVTDWERVRGFERM